VKFGLFYELAVPDPEQEAQTIRDVVTQGIHADRCGFDHVWIAEHHFLQHFSHSSAPEILFGAMAHSTERIRFGFGLALTPPAYNHPVRIAERAATLDCLSNGRVDIGVGRSTTYTELAGFGIDPNQSRAMQAEGAELLARLLSEEDVEYHGTHVSMPARTTYPRPVQKPHPPMWTGGVSAGNAERAAAMGFGFVFFAQKTDVDVLRDSVRAYKERIDDAVPLAPKGAVTNATAGFVQGLCGADGDATRRLTIPAVVEHTYRGNLAMTGWPDPEHPPAEYAHTTEVLQMRHAIEADREAFGKFFHEAGHIMAGTPEDCIKAVQPFADAGIDELIIHMQMGGVPHEAIMESIELFGRDVIPKFR
jgi:alkanesulfonate monooxygenase SsuD/methylene tetrahydromethanopterin reductase-like flavin-dependent oxidoreductase (luciferase family)